MSSRGTRNWKLVGGDKDLLHVEGRNLSTNVSGGLPQSLLFDDVSIQFMMLCQLSVTFQNISSLLLAICLMIPLTQSQIHGSHSSHRTLSLAVDQ